MIMLWNYAWLEDPLKVQDQKILRQEYKKFTDTVSDSNMATNL